MLADFKYPLITNFFSFGVKKINAVVVTGCKLTNNFTGSFTSGRRPNEARWQPD
jgi:hypothetical protein